jgi:hypothetical protein
MNYFLIANNDSITNETIEALPLKEEDVIILYNRQMPLKWDKIKKHKNKWLFIRSRNGFDFHNEEKLKQHNYSNFFLTSVISPFFKEHILCDNLVYNYKKKYNIDFNTYTYICDDLFNKNGKTPTTGFVSIQYLLLLGVDKMYTVGFTTEYKNKLWIGHSKDIEQEYYKNNNDKIIKL